jgi:hypothetical protein
VKPLSTSLLDFINQWICVAMHQLPSGAIFAEDVRCAESLNLLTLPQLSAQREVAGTGRRAICNSKASPTFQGYEYELQFAPLTPDCGSGGSTIRVAQGSRDKTRLRNISSKHP